MEDKRCAYLNSASRFLDTPYFLITPAHIINGLARIESKGYTFKKDHRELIITRKDRPESFFVKTFIGDYPSLREAILSTIGKFNLYYNNRI